MTVWLIDPKDIALLRIDKEERDDFECGWNACLIRILEYMRRIEAEPVRHGRWEDVSMDTVCSVCGTKFNDEMYWIQGDYMYPKRCPECGAKMDKKEESHATDGPGLA